MNIESPYKIKEIKFQRTYPGYVYRREVIDDSDYGGDGKLEMRNCYSTYNGDWIGNPKTARYLCKKRDLILVQKSKKTHCVASIGFNQKQQKWYGWSHRAICGFGIGDRVFTSRYGNDKTKFTQHGKVAIRTMRQAKRAAINFSSYVS
tara:strand:+ start:1640 stop:2083 length:444 start_codon:yes stop_codon:yes gene_type:complete